jgi:hypothetical protein
MEKVLYHGWNCYRLENKLYEIFVTADAGPRIVHFSFKGEKNIFKILDAEVGEVVIDGWHLYGGHRLWHSPEAIPRSYIPDNTPPTVEVIGDTVRFIQDVEEKTGMQKEIDILMGGSDEVTITHRIRNHNLWSVRTGVWALTIMAEGGRNILPLPARGRHEDHAIDPCNTMTMWPFTDLSDERWYLGKKNIMLTHTPGKGEGQKIGLSAPDGWIACAANNNLFVKRFTYDPNAEYPDLGNNVAVFTNPLILELETLGPLEDIKPGGFAEHVERWQLFKNVKAPSNDDDITKYVLPLIAK